MFRVLFLLSFCCVSGVPLVGQADESITFYNQWSQHPILFTGTVTKVIPGPVGTSLPPYWTHKLNIKITAVTRGDLKVDDEILVHHAVRQELEPIFPEGKQCIVAVSFVRKQYRLEQIEVVTKQNGARLIAAAALPLGWKALENGSLSPWASKGSSYWPGGPKPDAGGIFICQKTGRPPLGLGKGVSFSVQKVPPKQEFRFKNPDGDGEYRITVKNTTDKSVKVPALLSHNDKILWAECLLIRCQEKIYLHPDSKSVPEYSQVTLKPGESVSTTINALRLQGPEWPRGGYRIEFQFCLGEKSQVESFYYYSAHHDPIREQLRKQ